MKGGQMIRLELWGDYASFNRPELKVERYSYDVITPSAARNILQSIYWHPEFNWVIDKIYIISPGDRITITRNETNNKGSFAEMRKAAEKRTVAPHLRIDQTQRSSSILKSVRYVIEAHFEPSGKGTFDEDKIYAIFTERAKKGKCFKTPFLGCREFAANFELIDNSKPIQTANITVDYGLMLYDIDYSGDLRQPYYYHAVAKNGIIDLRECEVIR